MVERSVQSSTAGLGSRTEDQYLLLLVDDDETVLSLLHGLLARDTPHRMSTAVDPQTALELLRQESVDLLITDYRMPGMTGLDLIREARLLHPDLVAILVTGFAWSDAPIEAMAVGAYDMMLKPLNIGEVHVRVRNACERIRLVRENRAYRRELERARQEAAQGGPMMEFVEPIAGIGLFPPTPSPAAGRPRREDPTLEQLERLGKLYQAGLLTKEEFVLSKNKLFGRT